MTSRFFAIKRRVTIDGIDVTHVTDIAVDNRDLERENVDIHDHNFGVEIDLDKYNAAGSLTIKAKDNAYGNDPMPLIDFFSLISGYGEYDTTNDVVNYTHDSQSNTTTGTIGPNRIVEIRQTEATASQKIDNEAGTSEAWAQSFVAAGEDISAVKLKCYTTAGGPLESFQMEIWSDDGAGKPNAKVASTNTVTVYCSAGVDTETDDYIGALTNGAAYTDATWETIDMSLSLPDIMDGEDLVIGDTYWLVMKETATTTDDLFICYSSNDNYEGGKCLRDDDVDVAPAWGDATAGAKDLTFVIQFEAKAGHQIKIYDYKDATTGYVFTYNGVSFDTASMNFAAKKAAEATLKWKAQTVTGPTAF
jgi:hypothetical protein